MIIEGVSIYPTTTTNSDLSGFSTAVRRSSGTEVTSTTPEQVKIREAEVIKAIETSNEKIEAFGRRLQFSIHEKTKEIMVKVIDTKTEEVIREIPPEKILDMIGKMCELAGIFVDKRI